MQFYCFKDEDSLCNKLCTFTVTQKEFMNQHWYHCHTCKMNDGVGVCTVCAKVCHKDHDISYAKYGSFFCDCGAKEDGSCIVSIDDFTLDEFRCIVLNVWISVLITWNRLCQASLATGVVSDLSECLHREQEMLPMLVSQTI